MGGGTYYICKHCIPEIQPRLAGMLELPSSARVDPDEETGFRCLQFRSNIWDASSRQ